MDARWTSFSSNVSYLNESFGIDEELWTVNELFEAFPNKAEFSDTKLKPTFTRDSKPEAVSPPRQVVAEQSNKPKTSRQKFGRTDVVPEVGWIDESSEIREFLGLVCVLLLFVAGVVVLLKLIHFKTDSIMAAALTTVSSCVTLVFISIFIVAFVKDSASLHEG